MTELARGPDVVVTGLGVVSALGRGPAAHWAGLLAADTGPECVEWARVRPGQPGHVLAHAVPAGVALPGPGAGRCSRLAVLAARDAVAAAGLAQADLAGAGVVLGTSIGDLGPEQDGPDQDRADQDRADQDRRERCGPGPLAPGAAAARAVGAGGPVAGVATGCSSGAAALALGVDLLAEGEAEVVLVGGADALSPVSVACFARLDLLDPVRCRPFDAARAGTVPGEGAAVLVLESGARAARRGARPLARVLGAATTCDAHHLVTPEPGAAAAVAAAARALDGTDVGAVLPHRAGLAGVDAAQDRVARAVLPAAHAVPGYSAEALTGHANGAASALSCLAAVLVVAHATVPPNAHVEVPDPDCPLRVPTRPEPLAVPRVLVTSTGFGGSNAAVVLGVV